MKINVLIYQLQELEKRMPDATVQIPNEKEDYEREMEWRDVKMTDESTDIPNVVIIC